MTINLRRLAVGIETVEHLAEVQTARLAAAPDGRLFTFTRNAPRRADELVGQGSLYWIIKGQYRVRQVVLAIETDTDDEGRRFCRIELDPTHHRLRPTRQKAFQGWRYLKPEDAPPDDRNVEAKTDDLPEDMADELRDLGLL